MTRDPSTQVADAVAGVCAEVSGIRARLESAVDTSLLDQLIAAVRDGGEVAERLDELHAALQRCGTRSVCSDPPGGAFAARAP